MSDRHAHTSGSPTGILAEAEISIPARFRQIAAAHPRHPAIVGSTWQPTYAELDAATDQLARIILSSGGKPGTCVALLLQHDAPLIAATLAVLKAGCIVVVLNSRDPVARLKQILDDAAADCLVTDLANNPLGIQIAEKHHALIVYEKQIPAPAQLLALEIAPTAIAWLIYTSGSMGRPKGVMQSHRNIVHNVWRLSHGMKITPADRLVMLGSPSGGQGVHTIWCALLNGATLLPFPIAEKGATALKKWLPKNHATVYISSPSVFHNFTKSLDATDSFPGIRIVRLGSELATASHFAAFKKHFAHGCLLNSLSSSETGNIAQQPLPPQTTVTENRLSVGHESPGLRITLLDDQGQEVPPGETGEIHIHSHYLSPGYWHNDLLTAERFSPAGDANALRTFRSGDLGRRLPDGSLAFIGRKDARIKIHGYRVELSEIRDVLEQQPTVGSAFVTARPLPDGDNQILAYLAPQSGQALDAGQLRRQLRETLPAYMVPTHLIFLATFPLTPHGKIDRDALPQPPSVKKELPRSARPQDLVETRLTRIWESTLGIAPIGRHDNFFDLGGTSLQSVEILLDIESTFGALLPPSILTEHSTIQQLAAVIAGHVVIRSPSPLIHLREAPAGRPLFLIHTAQGDVTTYGPLVRRLASRPIYGLQSVGLHGESWPLMSIAAMARRYLAEIIAKDPTGPYLLGGTCMGGIVAFEIAQLLRQQGKQVALLALLDTSHPIKFWEEDDPWQMIYAPFRNPVRDGLRLLRWSVIRAVGQGRTARSLPAYRRFITHLNGRANRRYTPKLYPDPVTLFITANTPFFGEDRRLLMRRYTPEVRVIPIPGTRAELYRPPTVDELARQLQQALDAAENQSTQSALLDQA